MAMKDSGQKGSNKREHPRQRLSGRRGCVVWLTGLSGSGKSTIAAALQKRLVENGCAVYVLDGDKIRQGLNCDLGFSKQDRDENIRRISHVASLFADAGIITIAAFISPFRAARAKARRIVGAGRFIEIFVDAPLKQCQKRDPKGLYRKANQALINDFTGIGSPYERPQKPELVLKTATMAIERCVDRIVAYLKKKRFINLPDTVTQLQQNK